MTQRLLHRHRLATAIVALLFLASPAAADRLTVMTSGGFTAPLLEVLPQFERSSAHQVTTVFGASMGNAPDSIPVRLRRGEAADVVIMAAEAIEDLAARGTLVAATRVDLVRSRIGMVVRAGAPKPDISTVDALVTTLLNARSIAYSASASGTYLSTELFPRLGIADRIAARSRRIESERVAAVVARGDAEVGFQQISELLPVPGVDLVGPLPAGAQRETIFAAAIVSGSAHDRAAGELIAFLASAAAVDAIHRNGLEPASPVLAR
jgi:molybdate transport system substrate-binding protein